MAGEQVLLRLGGVLLSLRGLRDRRGPARQGGQGVGEGIRRRQGRIQAVIDLPLAAGEGGAGGVELVQAAGGGAETAAHALQGVQDVIQTVGDGVVGRLRLVLGLPQVRHLLQLLQGGGHRQEHHAVVGEVLGPHPDGEVPLLPGEHRVEHAVEVAHQLDLGPGGLHREGVVAVEDGEGGEDQVVPAVCRGPRIGHGVQGDLHHPLAPCQRLRRGGHAVELIGEGDSPGEVLVGLRRLSLEVEPVRHIAGQLEADGPLLHGGALAVGEVGHLVVDAVVHDFSGAVGPVAFDHAALQQSAIGVQGGVAGLVAGGGDIRRPDGGGAAQGQQQRQGEGQYPPAGGDR